MKNNKSEETKDLQTLMDKVPDHLFIKCPVCEESFYNKKLGEYKLCPNCGYGFRLGAQERINMTVDEFTPIDSEISAPKRFLGDEKYAGKLEKSKKATDLNESVQTGFAKIGDTEFALGVMDSRFIMGSLGTATGEKLARLFEQATEKNLPVVVFSCSGGARMQEGIHSLMQMAKVSQAVSDHAEKGLLYISVLTDPTTGGVTASYAMEGDINISEPHTLIGFAGRRVIEKTIQQRPPKDFQRAETLLKNGFLDAIVKRDEMKSVLAKLLAWN
ncbi:Acetyl-coenzyme A carboxylase carboxyl transferase subunit beta [Apilactobacillus kunkeei]|uniref:acetyl-CoA carboxylase carboxyltransferase subunit beta n=1 Tax=Apilactobacillus TaxID=2767877 RepID=UPI0018DB05E3|nr:acetyl-CoA carboxylase carboxyl transferase subunit beta [Lactobacillus sp. M0345]MCT6839964.1 acetyl-CoA carboxylase carboxyl transferase subunit beta [Apilactobacillus kunkeei]CAI2644162.1 Acetyl-coenzyme A carboxylase carboxyl transferase subunit beta [Apilactobacillus kunkeei]CAI2649031.1 Acetyl-coenzyme A carboxylase carboxyl transferase subunit beta [Apilactobacillus kunkeei]CAI2655067.1 Acetyl-coenzyme A carboxylase carboxyl transferase subunit beta [Apilactobacillus kunkeei]